MKKIYLAVFITFVISAILFIASLFYLDKEKRKSYYFTVNVNDHDIGTIKIDKFVTDDNLLYKSQSSIPFMPLNTESKSRLTLNRGYGLVNYIREDSQGRAENTVYLEDTNNSISFVGTSVSEFAYVTGLPVKHNTFVFEEYSPVTYLPILENYDFNIGKAQVFNVITNYSPLLPPMKRLLILASIGDEYIKIGPRKIKVERLLIRMKNLQQGTLFVTKTGRSLIGIEFPDKKLKITRTFTPKNFKAESFSLKDGAYTEENVKFNNKNTTLAGTLTVPKKEGAHPAALLIGAAEEGDREEQGIFNYLADMLAKNDFLVLRFDGRGTGASGGDSKSVTNSEGFDDARTALSYLLGRKDVDAGRIIIIGHGKGAFYSVKIASEAKNIKGLILMAPLVTLAGQTELNFDNLNEMAVKHKWDEQYLKLAIKSRMETIDKVKSARKDWALILEKRCFLKKLKEGLEENPTDFIRKVECPVLILYGKEDRLVPSKDVANLDKALEDSGNKNHKLIYYGYLGHLFGKLVDDGKYKIYYEIDPAVLDTTRKWLADNI